jgi:hypothetical protein
MEQFKNGTFTRSKSPLLLAGALIMLLAIAGLVWQQHTIANLNDELSKLKKTQLPQQQYAGYEDCSNNGGVLLNTVNGQFSACLSGSDEQTAERPQYLAFLQYSSQNLPRLEENKVNQSGKNIILSGAASNELTQFLENSYSGCEIGSSDASIFAPAYLKIKSEVQNRYALINYGCADDHIIDKTFSIAIKLADGWRWISTTNNMNEQGVPSCLVVDMFKISKLLTPKCYENTGYNNGSLKDVTYL